MFAFLTGLTQFALHRPWATFLVASVLAVASAMVATLQLRLDSHREELLPDSHPQRRLAQRFQEQFGNRDFLAIVVGGPVAESRKGACVDALAEQLAAAEAVGQVFAGVNPQEQLWMATRGMTEQQLEQFHQSAHAFPVMLAACQDAKPGEPVSQDAFSQDVFSERTTSEKLIDPVDRALREGTRLIQRGVASRIFRIGGNKTELAASGVVLLHVVAASVQLAFEQQQSSWQGPDALGEVGSWADQLVKGLETKYFSITDSSRYLVRVLPEADPQGRLSIEAALPVVRQVVQDVRRQFPQVEIELTGYPVMMAERLEQRHRDCLRASLLAVVLVGLFLIVVLRSFVLPSLVLASLGYGVSWTFGLTALTIGHLNLITVVAGPILIGVGIALAVHLVFAFREQRQRDHLAETLSETVLAVGWGHGLGIFAAVLAILAAWLFDYRGVRELGLILGCGLLLCTLANLLVLPAALVLADRGGLVKIRGVVKPRILNALPLPWSSSRPRLLSLSAVCVTAFLLPGLSWLRLGNNSLANQPSDLPSMQCERRLLADEQGSWFATVTAEDPQQLCDLVKRAEALDSVGRVDCLFDVIQPPSPRREQLRAELPRYCKETTAKPQKESLSNHSLQLSPVDLRRGGRALQVLAKAGEKDLGSYHQAVSACGRRLHAAAEHLECLSHEDASEFRLSVARNFRTAALRFQIMLQGDRLPLQAVLPQAACGLFTCWSPEPTGHKPKHQDLNQPDLNQPELNQPELNNQNPPAESDGPRFLAMLHPRADVADVAQLSVFAEDVRRLDPQATGQPLRYLESLQLSGQPLIPAILLTLVSLGLLASLGTGRLRAGFLIVVPVGCALIWMLATLGWLGLPLNLVSLACLPLLAGLGLSSGIHGLLRPGPVTGSPPENLPPENLPPESLPPGTLRSSTLLPALATLIGFASLLSATHPGTWHLGLCLSIASLATLFWTLALFPFLSSWAPKTNNQPLALGLPLAASGESHLQAPVARRDPLQSEELTVESVESERTEVPVEVRTSP